MTLTGNGVALIVVDDPHGYCVPSAGVQIIRPPAMGKSMIIASAAAFMDMGPVFELTHRPEPAYPRPERKRPRKGKQRFKGLRP